MKMPHWPKPVGYLQNEESLLRMQEILSRLGNPHKNLPQKLITVHVAGTNGKGSTIAFLRAILEASGARVHCYHTPHLVEFNERITLAGEYISDEYLHEVMERVRLNSEDIDLGFYEATTAGAFLAFSEVDADYLLLETGMGGRLDATNIIDPPELCIMTTISKDHTAFLGDDVASIANEKKHIIKSKCISGLQYDEAFAVLEDWCAQQNIELTAFGYDFMVEKIPTSTYPTSTSTSTSTHPVLDTGSHEVDPVSSTGCGLLYKTPQGDEQFGKPALLGYHQYMNCAVAIAAAKELGVAIAGLENVKWKSRLEKMDLAFVPDNFEFYLDGAHNAAAAFALANMIEEDWNDKPTYLIYGTTQGRDTNEFLQKLKNSVEHIALVKVNCEPNSYLAENIAFEGESTKHQHIKDAVEHITNHHKAGRILCCGSLFMRGDLV